MYKKNYKKGEWRLHNKTLGMKFIQINYTDAQDVHFVERSLKKT